MDEEGNSQTEGIKKEELRLADCNFAEKAFWPLRVPKPELEKFLLFCKLFLNC
jgi:hypothetical protein